MCGLFFLYDWSIVILLVKRSHQGVRKWPPEVLVWCLEKVCKLFFFVGIHGIWGHVLFL